MSESDNSDLEAGIHEPAAFGQQLMLAREKAGMTIEEAARALNLNEDTVEAIEDSDLHKLPPVTFVRGYVQAYARLLGLSEERIIREFDEEVPHERESELHPRLPAADEADSQTPVIKLITAVIIVLAVVVLLVAIYSYYSEKSERMEQASQAEQDDAAAMQLPLEAPLIEQDASTSDAATPSDDEIPVAEQDEAVQLEVTPAEESQAEENQAEEVRVEAAEAVPQAVEPVVAAEAVEAAVSETIAEEIMPVQPIQPITGGDVLALSVEQECWAEIVDANDIRLFYGTIRPGRDLNLTGQAPFDIFLGNAPVVTLSLNSIDIDMTKYIRSNNIAQFKISVEDGRVRFQ